MEDDNWNNDYSDLVGTMQYWYYVYSYYSHISRISARKVNLILFQHVFRTTKNEGKCLNSSFCLWISNLLLKCKCKKSNESNQSMEYLPTEGSKSQPADCTIDCDDTLEGNTQLGKKKDPCVNFEKTHMKKSQMERRNRRRRSFDNNCDTCAQSCCSILC